MVLMDVLPLITLTTDFGLADAYVGSMKGVILGIIPDVRLVDVTHQISPQDVRQTAYVLYTLYRFFPPHTVHLVVVDPGVGGARRAIAVRTAQGSFVGPDNGVFSYVMADQPVEAIVELTNPRYRCPQPSQTFHGRDIFAPAAAHLAAGVPIDQFGPSVVDPVTLPLPRLRVSPGGVSGEVLHIDRFGNAITSIGRLVWEEERLALEPAFGQIDVEAVRFRAHRVSVRAGGQEVQGVRRTYAEVVPGDALALVGSAGHLEIAVREGNGARELGLQLGDPVELRW
jgi:S-adenosylmethionine hydrolase